MKFSACEGLYENVIRYDNNVYDAKLLMHDMKAGVDKSVGPVSWYPVPHAIVTIGDETYQGTYKHFNCTKVILNDPKKRICQHCSEIPSLHSFKQRLMLRSQRTKESNRDLDCVRYEYLTTEEVPRVLKKKDEEIGRKDSHLFFLKKKNIRLRIRVRSMKEKLAEFSSRGDMRAICHQLTKAYDLKYFKNKDVLLSSLSTIAKNFHAKGKQGHRYQDPVKKFYESLLITGGPKICTFLAQKLNGSEKDLVYR